MQSIIRADTRRLLEAMRLLPAAQRLNAHVSARKPLADRTARDEAAVRVALAITLREDSHCVDVGAHTGTILGTMLRLAPRGRHVAFEPLPHLAAQLRTQFPTVDVREVALSDSARRAVFHYVRTNAEYSGLRRRTYPGAERVEMIEVSTAALDDCLPADFRPAVIKIDVEGAEAEVLRGAARTISDHRPLILFEHGIGGADHYGTSPAEVFRLLCDAGLRIFDSDGVGPYTEDDFCASFTAPMWNWIAM